MKSSNPVVVSVRGPRGNTFKMECLIEKLFEDNPWLMEDQTYIEDVLFGREIYCVNDGLRLVLKST